MKLKFEFMIEKKVVIFLRISNDLFVNFIHRFSLWINKYPQGGIMKLRILAVLVGLLLGAGGAMAAETMHKEHGERHHHGHHGNHHHGHHGHHSGNKDRH